MTINERLKTLTSIEAKLTYLDSQISNLKTNLSICISMGKYQHIQSIKKDIDEVKRIRKDIEEGNNHDRNK